MSWRSPAWPPPPAYASQPQPEFWRDALGAEYRCTTAGTPGTWIQTGLAAVTADPSTGTIPTGYLIRNVTTGHVKKHAGSYAWEIPPAQAVQHFQLRR